ncbi:MAG TPA: hypothetical protein VHZ81_05820 [Galbitalea sp.]|nr:hypothetical protein [Galbitalea sp.]
MNFPHPGGPGFSGFGAFGTIITDIVAGLFFLVCFAIVVGLLFLLVRFLLVATRAAEIYVAKNSAAETTTPTAPVQVPTASPRPRTTKAPPTT